MSALQTAVEKAMSSEVTRDKNIIPPMIHPLSKHWRQPNPATILIDDKHAVMTKAQFDDLADYTQSQPSGVYPGKMWKASYHPLGLVCPKCQHPNVRGIHGGNVIKSGCVACGHTWDQEPAYFLCWFTFGNTPDTCATYYRQILVA